MTSEIPQPTSSVPLVSPVEQSFQPYDAPVAPIDVVARNRNQPASYEVFALRTPERNAAVAHSSTGPTGQFLPDGTSTTDPEEVDSALLSAMRDHRERVALLRLEQVMLDFMKDSELQAIDVGGPYNSIVVGLNKSHNPEAQNGGNPRQTSFQRCCLHRLADRFRITRDNMVHIDGLIRLVKRDDSRIPKKLLINLEPSEYFESGSDSDIHGVTQAIGVLNTGGKPRKMKIMKRDSSSVGGPGSLRDGDKKSSGRKTSASKNLSEKEKAYAEARARIFNEGDGSSHGTTIDLKPSQVEGNHTPPSSNPVYSSTDANQCEEQLDESKQRPKAATMGGISKVTWRNRQQEENDPDFQRGHAYIHSEMQYYSNVQYSQQSYFPNHQYDNHTQYYVPQYYGGRGRGRGRGQNGGRAGFYRRQGQGRGTANVQSLDDFPALR